MAAAPHRDHIRRRLPPLRDMSFDASSGPIVIEEQPRPVPTRSEPSFKQQIDDAIATVERAMASLDTLRRDVRSRQQEAEALKREIQAGQSEEQQLKDRIGDLERVIAAERKRTAAAEHRARQIDTNIDELERRIAAVRAETEQLLGAATLLLSGEAGVSPPQRGARRPRYAA